MAELREEYRRKNTFWRNWGAVIILAVFFVTSWGGQFVNQLTVEKTTSRSAWSAVRNERLLAAIYELDIRKLAV